jgi:hypothetical protein
MLDAVLRPTNLLSPRDRMLQAFAQRYQSGARTTPVDRESQPLTTAAALRPERSIGGYLIATLRAVLD